VHRMKAPLLVRLIVLRNIVAMAPVSQMRCKPIPGRGLISIATRIVLMNMITCQKTRASVPDQAVPHQVHLRAVPLVAHRALLVHHRVVHQPLPHRVLLADHLVLLLAALLPVHHQAVLALPLLVLVVLLVVLLVRALLLVLVVVPLLLLVLLLAVLVLLLVVLLVPLLLVLLAHRVAPLLPVQVHLQVPRGAHLAQAARRLQVLQEVPPHHQVRAVLPALHHLLPLQEVLLVAHLVLLQEVQAHLQVVLPPLLVVHGVNVTRMVIVKHLLACRIHV